MTKPKTPERAIPLLNPLTLDLQMEVAREHLCLPQTRLNIAKLLTAGRSGRLAPDVGAYPKWAGWNSFYFAPEGEFSEQNRARLVRAVVMRENAGRIESAVEDQEDDYPTPEDLHPMLETPFEEEREERETGLRVELEAGLEPLIAARLARGPADWQYVKDGIWHDVSSGAAISIGAEPFELQIMLGELDFDAVDRGGCQKVVATDVEGITEADVARFEQQDATLVRLGSEYRRALETRLDALRSPLVTLPEV